jgi:Mn-dependent DtxR family transcriptional regulator
VSPDGLESRVLARAREGGGATIATIADELGVSTNEVRAAVASLREAGHLPKPQTNGTAKGNGAAAATEDLPGTIRADRVTMRSIEWLDKPFLQRSAFELFVGPKGVGKGTKLAAITADFTRGAYGDHKNVVYVSSEDSMEVDTVPRLVAADADLERVTFVTRNVKLPDDLGWLRGLASTLGSVGLVILDPVGNHVGGVDTDKEGLVRHAIGGLNDLANDLGCTIIGVRHLTKNTAAGALASVLGSTAWRDVPRTVVAFARDDEDDNVIHWQVVAGNRSGRGATRHFRIELHNIGLEEPVTRAADLGASTKDVDQLLEPKAGTSRTGSARELLLDILDAEGPQESDALDARIARETGLAAGTVRNARTKLKNDGLIHVHPDKDEQGGILRWKVSRTLAERP